MLTWEKVKQKKQSQYQKEQDEIARIISEFDINKAMQNLMKRIHKNGSGTYEYSIFDLRPISKIKDFFWTLGYFEYLYLEYKDTKKYAFECMVAELEKNDIEYKKVDGYYAVKITLP